MPESSWPGWYVCICTVHAYVICMYMSSYVLHILGGISEIRMQYNVILCNSYPGREWRGISDLRMQCTCQLVHFTFREYIWSKNAMHMSSCALHIWGVYLISECNVHVMFCTSYPWGVRSDLRMHFILKIYCHYLYYELLNTAQCRLLYVVVIVITVAYSHCCFWSFYV